MLRRRFCGGNQSVVLLLAEMFRLRPVTCITKFGERTMYMVYRLTMGRLSKVVLLSLLLILSGVPGAASLLCAQPMKSHAHACCMAHRQIAGSHCAPSSVQSRNPSCCKVAPINSTPVQNLVLSGGSSDGAVVMRALSGMTGDVPAPILLLGRGSPRLAKLQHSPVHALLCTFLV
jgi:hypothetical protein